ncbi:MAG: serine/threonine protein kinase [Planctomycetes bacterium]|nr:serine/threonine protein kinase [Planctomycetota bacterium]
MDAARFERILEVFDAARQQPTAGRDRFVRERCGGDASLIAEVHALLAADADPSGPLGESQLGCGVATGSVLTPGIRIGRYEILETLGEGGMGVVYRALQTEPVQRVVALKVLRPGMQSAEGRARFAAERQTLALMSHPHIARIYDAGTSDGAPYFVMEFVEGTPLTTHAERCGLGRAERLRLILDVCAGVHHAHQKGVIHRDLKPCNILVEHSGLPKILDFGIARAVGANHGTQVLRTRAGQLLGTLPYMSPEQLTGDPDGADTRLDVYAVGVILYELLTGRLPHELTDKPLAEAVRVLLETDAMPAERIAPQLRGDLATILAKALAKDRERRYGSIAEFADDIRRFLDDRPIRARPTSTAYQLRKYVQRNKLLVGAACALLAVMGGAMTVSLLALGRARSEEALAKESEARAQSVLEFLRGALGSTHVLQNPRGVGYTMREFLDEAAQRVNDLHGQPAAEAEARFLIGDAYLALDMAREAEPHLQRVLALQRSTGVPTDRVAATVSKLGVVAFGNGDLQAAEQHYREAISMTRPLGSAFHPQLASCLGGLAGTLSQRGQQAAAKRSYEDALALLTSGHPAQRIATLDGLANVLLHLGEVDAAAAAIAEAARLAGSPDREAAAQGAARLQTEARLLLKRGDHAGAAPLLRRALAQFESVLGKQHDRVASTLGLLARVEELADRKQEAEALYRRAIEIRQQARGRAHPELALLHSSLGALYSRQRRHGEAQRELTAALKIQVGCYGEQSAEASTTQFWLGSTCYQQRQFAAAVGWLQKALATRESTLGSSDERTIACRSALATALTGRGDFDAAVTLLRRNADLRQNQFGAEHANTIAAQKMLSSSLVSAGQFAAAAQLCSTLAAYYRKKRNVPKTIAVLNGLALAELGLQQRARAAAANDQAMELCAKEYGLAARASWVTRRIHACVLAAGESSDAVVRAFTEVLADGSRLRIRRWRLGEVRAGLAQLLIRRGERTEAKTVLEAAVQDLRADRPASHPLRRRAEADLQRLVEQLAVR